MLTSILTAAALSLALQTADTAAVHDQTAVTQLPPVDTTGTPPTEEPDRARVVCRTETMVGSRMPQRRCISQRQDDQLTRESRALAHRLDVQNSRTRPLANTAGRGGE